VLISLAFPRFMPQSPSQAAIDTGDRMTLCQQHAHDTRTDMPRAPNDTDVHRVVPPSAHCSTRGPEVQDGIFGPKRHKGLCQHSLGRRRLKNNARLVLDARGVDGLGLCNLMLATLASLQSFLCNGLKKGWPFSDNVRAEDSWHPRRARVFLDIHSHGERARLWQG
jgi:hypothetical protein